MPNLVTEEMGKSIIRSITEIEKCVLVCEFYFENAESFLRDELVPTEVHLNLGVVAGIMPWNFPFWQVTRYESQH